MSTGLKALRSARLVVRGLTSEKEFEQFTIEEAVKQYEIDLKVLKVYDCSTNNSKTFENYGVPVTTDRTTYITRPTRTYSDDDWDLALKGAIKYAENGDATSKNWSDYLCNEFNGNYQSDFVCPWSSYYTGGVSTPSDTGDNIISRILTSVAPITLYHNTNSIEYKGIKGSAGQKYQDYDSNLFIGGWLLIQAADEYSTQKESPGTKGIQIADASAALNISLNSFVGYEDNKGHSLFQGARLFFNTATHDEDGKDIRVHEGTCCILGKKTIDDNNVLCGAMYYDDTWETNKEKNPISYKNEHINSISINIINNHKPGRGCAYMYEFNTDDITDDSLKNIVNEGYYYGIKFYLINGPDINSSTAKDNRKFNDNYDEFRPAYLYPNIPNDDLDTPKEKEFEPNHIDRPWLYNSQNTAFTYYQEYDKLQNRTWKDIPFEMLLCVSSRDTNISSGNNIKILPFNSATQSGSLAMRYFVSAGFANGIGYSSYDYKNFDVNETEHTLKYDCRNNDNTVPNGLTIWPYQEYANYNSEPEKIVKVDWDASSYIRNHQYMLDRNDHYLTVAITNGEQNHMCWPLCVASTDFKNYFMYGLPSLWAHNDASSNFTHDTSIPANIHKCIGTKQLDRMANSVKNNLSEDDYTPWSNAAAKDVLYTFAGVTSDFACITQNDSLQLIDLKEWNDTTPMHLIGSSSGQTAPKYYTSDNIKCFKNKANAEPVTKSIFSGNSMMNINDKMEQSADTISLTNRKPYEYVTDTTTTLMCFNRLIVLPHETEYMGVKIHQNSSPLYRLFTPSLNVGKCVECYIPSSPSTVGLDADPETVKNIDFSIAGSYDSVYEALKEQEYSDAIFQSGNVKYDYDPSTNKDLYTIDCSNNKPFINREILVNVDKIANITSAYDASIAVNWNKAKTECSSTFTMHEEKVDNINNYAYGKLSNFFNTCVLRRDINVSTQYNPHTLAVSSDKVYNNIYTIKNEYDTNTKARYPYFSDKLILTPPEDPSIESDNFVCNDGMLLRIEDFIKSIDSWEIGMNKDWSNITHPCYNDDMQWKPNELLDYGLIDRCTGELVLLSDQCSYDMNYATDIYNNQPERDKDIMPGPMAAVNPTGECISYNRLGEYIDSSRNVKGTSVKWTEDELLAKQNKVLNSRYMIAAINNIVDENNVRYKYLNDFELSLDPSTITFNADDPIGTIKQAKIILPGTASTSLIIIDSSTGNFYTAGLTPRHISPRYLAIELKSKNTSPTKRTGTVTIRDDSAVPKYGTATLQVEQLSYSAPKEFELKFHTIDYVYANSGGSIRVDITCKGSMTMSDFDNVTISCTDSDYLDDITFTSITQGTNITGSFGINIKSGTETFTPFAEIEVKPKDSNIEPQYVNVYRIIGDRYLHVSGNRAAASSSPAQYIYNMITVNSSKDTLNGGNELNSILYLTVSDNGGYHTITAKPENGEVGALSYHYKINSDEQFTTYNTSLNIIKIARPDEKYNDYGVHDSVYMYKTGGLCEPYNK